MKKTALLTSALILTASPALCQDTLIPGWRTLSFLKPGESLTRIELVHALKGGIYRNALMRYECFTLDGEQKLNGADLRITVQAQ